MEICEDVSQKTKTNKHSNLAIPYLAIFLREHQCLSQHYSEEAKLWNLPTRLLMKEWELRKGAFYKMDFFF